MTFKKDSVPWNKGLTAETDERVFRGTRAVIKANKNRSKQHQTNINHALKGRKVHNKGRPWEEWMSESGQQNSSQSQFKPDHAPWNKGLPWEQWMPPEGIENQREWCTSKRARKHLLENSLKVSQRREEDPEFATRLIRNWQVAIHQTPNKAEEWLGRLIELACPGMYVYNMGDFILGGKVPDFVNYEDKRVIELFGELFHAKEEEQIRTEWFEKLGYKTLIIWYNELISDQKAVAHKIYNFEHGVEL